MAKKKEVDEIFTINVYGEEARFILKPLVGDIRVKIGLLEDYQLSGPKFKDMPIVKQINILNLYEDKNANI